MHDKLFFHTRSSIFIGRIVRRKYFTRNAMHVITKDGYITLKDISEK